MNLDFTFEFSKNTIFGFRHSFGLKNRHMKKISNSILALLFLATSLSAFANPTIVQVEPFDEISVSGNVNVYLESGNTEEVEISEKDHKITVEVSNGVLRIKRKNPLKIKEYKGEPVDIKVTYRKLRRVRGAAGSTISNSEAITGDQLRLNFHSGAQGRMLVDVNDLDISVSEGAQLKVRGKTISQSASVSTGAGLSAHRLESDRTYVKANTGGNANVVANDLLEARASTGGNIDYEGNPRKVKIKDTLGGNVSGGR